MSIATVSTESFSVVIPACNESETVGGLVAQLKAMGAPQIIVVDDGSQDNTAEVARAAGAEVICNPYQMGNGAAIKAGFRAAHNQIVVFMDGDGQHRPQDIPKLLVQLAQGYDLIIGARSRAAQANRARALGNWIYNQFASWMSGHRIADLTSGFRAVRADRFRDVVLLLPNGFSYPTTSTMAFYRLGYSVGFVPIDAQRRLARTSSHINLFKDGGRFLLIIFRVTALYSPLKLFFPASLLFAATGIVYYLYTFLTDGRFTNFGALLMTTSILIFLIGLVSEQITALTYSQMTSAASSRPHKQ